MLTSSHVHAFTPRARVCRKGSSPNFFVGVWGISIIPNFKNWACTKSNKYFYLFDHGKLLLKGLRRSTRDIELRHHIARSCPKKVPIWMQLAKAMMANTSRSQIGISDFTSNPVAYCNLLQNLECTSVCEHRTRRPFLKLRWPDFNYKT